MEPACELHPPHSIRVRRPALVAALALVSLDARRPARRDRRARSRRSPAPRRSPAYVPPVKHVFVINIENKGYDTTWGAGSAAPYLARTLRAKGVLLNTYYGTAHNSQPNYVAQISGQGPNPQMQADCQVYSSFVRRRHRAPGQAVGSGCVFPASVA